MAIASQSRGGCTWRARLAWGRRVTLRDRRVECVLEDVLLEAQEPLARVALPVHNVDGDDWQADHLGAVGGTAVSAWQC